MSSQPARRRRPPPLEERQPEAVLRGADHHVELVADQRPVDDAVDVLASTVSSRGVIARATAFHP